MKNFSFIILIIVIKLSFGQKNLSKISFELYGDFFINATLHQQNSHKISDILYSYNRTNELGINLAYIKTKYVDTNFRVNLALMSGTYGEDNYVEEDGLFRNLFEANVGYKLSHNINHWIDIGVFPSHIGFESATGYDCWNVSRSLLAENSPYFETGIKYTYTSKNEKFLTSILFLNGWQKIAMDAGHSIPSLGMQFNYKPNEKWILNYSNFIGSTQPDSIFKLRIYNNFYVQTNWTNKLSTIFNFDIGREQREGNQISYWNGGFGCVRYQLDNKQTFAMRLEYISDRDNVLYPQLGSDEWMTWSSSMNYDRKLNSFSNLRFELKYIKSSLPIFLPNEKEHLGGFVALQVKI